MSEDASAGPEGRTEGKPRKRAWVLLLLAAILIGVFFGNERIGGWLVREGLEHVAPRLGWRVEAGSVKAGLSRPIVLRDVKATTVDGRSPAEVIEADELVLAFNSPMEMFFGDGRVFRRVDGVAVNWSIDLREDGVRSPATAAVTGPAERERRAAMRLRFLPLTLAVRSGVARVESDHGTLQLVGINGALSESTVSKATVGSVEVRAGARSYVRRGLRAATSWRDGVAFFSDIALAESVVLRTLVASVADPAGTSLSLDLSVGSGDVRGDVSLTTRAGLLEIDLALSAAELPLESVAKLIGLSEPFGGVVREGRVTWRGTPGRWADSEIALRLEVEGLTRRGERWDSLVMGANFIGRRLYFSNFQLAAGENRVTANGEIAVPRGEAGWLDSNFLLNVSADVREMRKLAVFAGDWWSDLQGRLSLHGSVSGDDGRIDGYANGEASRLTLRGLPPASLKFATKLRDMELEVRSAEIWSGGDRLTAKGSLDLAAPHRYSGSVAGTMADVSRFTGKLDGLAAKWLESGGFTVSWQGDGTWAAHSGVFKATLADAATPWTPAGITGDFEGSYSPDNVHLSQLRLRNGPLEFNTRLTVSDAGINLADLDLKRRKLQLLAGEAFVPVNVFALVRGERPVDAIDLEKPVYARIGSGELPLAELVAMAGQDAVAGGTVKFRLEASGPLPTMALDGSVSAREVSAGFSGYQLPKTAVDLAISTEQSRLLVDGEINSKGFEPLVVEATMPFGFEIAEDGRARFFDQSAPVAAKTFIPRTNLSVVGALIPGIHATAGTISGALEIAGTVAAPEFRGELVLADGAMALSDPAVPGVTDLNARIQLAGTSIEIAEARGKVSGGEAEFSGQWLVAQKKPMRLALRASGVTVEAFGFRGLADVQLEAKGRPGQGLVTGTIEVLEGGLAGSYRASAELHVRDVSGGRDELSAQPPRTGWEIDARVDLQNGIGLGSGSDAGELRGDLRLAGALGAPRIAGRLALSKLTVRSAAGWPLPVSGTLYLSENGPAAPALALSGRSVISGQAVSYAAVGTWPKLAGWIRGLPVRDTIGAVKALDEVSKPLTPWTGTEGGRRAIRPFPALERSPFWIPIGIRIDAER